MKWLIILVFGLLLLYGILMDLLQRRRARQKFAWASRADELVQKAQVSLLKKDYFEVESAVIYAIACAYLGGRPLLLAEAWYLWAESKAELGDRNLARAMYEEALKNRADWQTAKPEFARLIESRLRACGDPAS